MLCCARLNKFRLKSMALKNNKKKKQGDMWSYNSFDLMLTYNFSVSVTIDYCF